MAVNFLGRVTENLGEFCIGKGDQPVRINGQGQNPFLGNFNQVMVPAFTLLISTFDFFADLLFAGEFL